MIYFESPREQSQPEKSQNLIRVSVVATSEGMEDRLLSKLTAQLE